MGFFPTHQFTSSQTQTKRCNEALYRATVPIFVARKAMPKGAGAIWPGERSYTASFGTNLSAALRLGLPGSPSCPLHEERDRQRKRGVHIENDIGAGVQRGPSHQWRREREDRKQRQRAKCRGCFQWR